MLMGEGEFMISIPKPFIKTNQNPTYININSNHPKNIIKRIPKAVYLRIGKLSANEKIFKESNKRYINALKSSGFNEDFRFRCFS